MQNKKVIMVLVVIVGLLLFSHYYLKTSGETRYAGVRATLFGYQQEQPPSYWVNQINTVVNKFEFTRPSIIYGIGGIVDGDCYLNFPHIGNYLHVQFSWSGEDENEEYLDAFDASGAKVFLQIEPGLANVPMVLKLVLDQYSHHPSVAGIGIDTEWLEYPTYNTGRKITDAEVVAWNNQINTSIPELSLLQDITSS